MPHLDFRNYNGYTVFCKNQDRLVRVFDVLGGLCCSQEGKEDFMKILCAVDPTL